MAVGAALPSINMDDHWPYYRKLIEGYILIWLLVVGFVFSVPAYLLCLVFFKQVVK